MDENLKNQKVKNVVEYYVLANKLKDVVRTGWIDWNVKRERVESIAEHIYGTMMLAIAMCSEFDYEIDLKKVLMMLSIHETEEILIGDLTVFQISRDEKAKRGHEAVLKIFSKLSLGDELEKIVFEFDERKTPEAKFAYFCDKLECDIQCKLYDEQNCVDLNNEENCRAIKDESVKELLKSGKSWSEMWMTFGQERYKYDENFLSVSNYVKDNNILKNS